MKVYKFGGTSIGSSDAIDRAAKIVTAASEPLCVVVSAMAGVTDLLLGVGAAALRGESEAIDALAEKFSSMHQQAIADLVSDPAEVEAVRAFVHTATEELIAIGQSLLVLRETTPRVMDLIAARGERALARIFCAVLRSRKQRVHYVDGIEVIVVEQRLGAVHAALAACQKDSEAKIRPWLDQGAIVIVPGFIGRTHDVDLVTLGRGGSDFSAAVLANSLNAESLTLYKEVDGLMTTDPRYVRSARLIKELHYREAAELAYYGAKILHPRTMIPLVPKRIPLIIKNTFNPEAHGTRIAGDVPAGEHPVKALTAITGQALIAIEGKGMMGVPGVAGRTFSGLAQAGLSVSVISQASSESSICFVVPEMEAARAIKSVRETFSFELEHELIDAVRQEGGVAVLAIVGLGMHGTPGVAARSFGAMARSKTNIIAIAQGSSELNISLVIKGVDVAAALQSLHDEFQLEKAHSLPVRDDQEINIALFGFGQIGAKLLEQILRQDHYIRTEMKLNWRCVALADRSGILTAKAGHHPEELQKFLSVKKGSGKLKSTGSLSLESTLAELRQNLWQIPFSRAVFVDTTAEETAPLLLEAVKAGFHLVLANKKPLAVDQEKFDELFDEARRRSVWVRYEATVGAGLPVLDTLAKLREAGDEVKLILGCLSGTLGLVMSKLEEGVLFSTAVREAHAAGYTEPDPREDLSGMDVARKALILARTLGRKLNIRDLEIEPVVKIDAQQDAAGFLATLSQFDGVFAERVKDAARRGAVLRYVARVTEKQVRVGIEEVEKASSLGGLKGTNNQIVVRTKRYDSHPLVVTGPGAGADVTAAGVMNDILAIGMGRDRRI